MGTAIQFRTPTYFNILHAKLDSQNDHIMTVKTLNATIVFKLLLKYLKYD